MGGSAKANLRQTFTKFFIRSSERDHSRQTDYRANAQVGIDGGVVTQSELLPSSLDKPHGTEPLFHIFTCADYSQCLSMVVPFLRTLFLD